MMILHFTDDSSSSKVVLVSITIVSLLLILSLSTSTAILAIYVLKIKKRKSYHSENTLANAEIGSVKLACAITFTGDRVISNKDKQKSVNVSAPSISRDQACKTSIQCKNASASHKNKTSVLSMHDVECQEKNMLIKTKRV